MEMLSKGIFFLLLFAVMTAHAQMNFQDSSVQVITFWDLGEKQEYAVTWQKLAYTESDTTSNETMTYEVEVSVVDSTQDSYIVRWFYKNFQSNSKNPIMQKLATATEDIAVLIKMNELGVLESVENWEEVRDYMHKSLGVLEKDFGKIPGMDRVFQQMKGMYSSRASIEATAIQDVQQLHNFHGARYFLNKELSVQIETSNLYDVNRPFDTEVSVVLEEMDEENNQFVIRSIAEVNSEQLAEAAFNLVKEMAENLGQSSIARERYVGIKNTIETVSVIHNTGWVLESILWKEVVIDGETNMEIRIIELK